MMTINSSDLNVPHGALPDDVIADPNSQGLIAFLVLDANATPASAQTFLKQLTAMLRSLEEPDDNRRVNFTSCVGFGPSFFLTAANSPRSGLTLPQIPVGFRQLPVLAGIQGSMPAMPGDMVIYAMSRREALVANLLSFLARNKGTISSVTTERGYQRADRREFFGFLDGLRNLPRDQRRTVIRTTEDIEPDGPPWAIGGTYLAYMKVLQNVPVAAQTGTSAMENVIGRRQDDGSRQDQPEHMDPREEPDFDPGGTVPGVGSHVRKAGPRGNDQRDGKDVFLFRRGVPFTELANDDTLETGLHFVGFARSLDYIKIVWNHWIMNPDFPVAGAGIDQLFQNNLINVIGGAFFFVPPDDRRFIGASIFLGPEHAASSHAAKVLVRKTILDQTGQPTLKILSGFGFTIFDANNNPVSQEFFTNSAGHAVSPELPLNQPLTLRETTNPLAGQGLQPQGDLPIAPLNPTQPPIVVACTNRFAAPSPPGYH
jgi:Dyp-type peroxidase family